MNAALALRARLTFPIVLGLFAGALTAAALLSHAVAHFVELIPPLEVTLELSIIVVMIPFGGIHEANVPEWLALSLASLFSAVVWGAVGFALRSFYRRVRTARASAINDRVT